MTEATGRKKPDSSPPNGSQVPPFSARPRDHLHLPERCCPRLRRPPATRLPPAATQQRLVPAHLAQPFRDARAADFARHVGRDSDPQRLPRSISIPDQRKACPRSTRSQSSLFLTPPPQLPPLAPLLLAALSAFAALLAIVVPPALANHNPATETLQSWTCRWSSPAGSTPAAFPAFCHETVRLPPSPFPLNLKTRHLPTPHPAALRFLRFHPAVPAATRAPHAHGAGARPSRTLPFARRTGEGRNAARKHRRGRGKEVLSGRRVSFFSFSLAVGEESG
nr:hypothetical protein CFP56_67359 [Quercus suber]